MKLEFLILKGLNAANSKHSCLWCKGEKKVPFNGKSKKALNTWPNFSTKTNEHI